MYSDAVITLLSKINTLSLAFTGLFALVVYVLFQVQKRKDFDFAEMLKYNGKPSTARLGMLLSLAISSWIVLQVAIVELSPSYTGTPKLVEILGLYLGIFAGAKVIEKGIDTWGKSSERDFSNRTEFKSTTQPDFEDTAPMDMTEVLGRR